MTNIVAAVIGAIVGGLATLLLKGRLGGEHAEPSTAVILLQGGSGTPRTASVFPHVICVPKGGEIEWEIRDLTNPHHDPEIEFDWVRHPKNPHGPKDPLTERPTKEGKKRRGRVKAHPGAKFFRYRVLENGQCVTDPDVEIMM